MPFPTATTWPQWVAAVILLSLAIAVQRRRKRARLPPGPTPFPIVGNILDVPRTHLGREFAAYTKKFGDVVHLSMLGQDFVVLGSLKAARDLLDKRSADYSDRPTSVMLQLVGYDWLTSLMNYGPRWRQHRRAMHPAMTPEVLPQYETVQVDAARNFLQTLLRDPQGLGSHIKFTFAAVFMGTIYGIEIREPHNKYYRMVERMGEIAEAATVPGNFPGEAFPVLRYLPSWFPGGGFKTWAADAKRDISLIVDHLFDNAKDAAVAMLRDPEVYSQPDDFVPERFLDSDGNLDVHGRDPTHVMFGFGRRLCPGRHFADSTLFILCASVLSTFEIGPPVDEKGSTLAEFKPEVTDNWIISHPKIYQYRISPRSPHVDRLVEMAHAK